MVDHPAHVAAAGYNREADKEEHIVEQEAAVGHGEGVVETVGVSPRQPSKGFLSNPFAALADEDPEKQLEEVHGSYSKGNREALAKRPLSWAEAVEEEDLVELDKAARFLEGDELAAVGVHGISDSRPDDISTSLVVHAGGEVDHMHAIVPYVEAPGEPVEKKTTWNRGRLPKAVQQQRLKEKFAGVARPATRASSKKLAFGAEDEEAALTDAIDIDTVDGSAKPSMEATSKDNL